MHTQGGAHTRRCTQKAVCSSAGVLLFKGGAGAGPRVERSEPSVERGPEEVSRGIPYTPGGGGGRQGGGGRALISHIYIYIYIYIYIHIHPCIGLYMRVYYTARILYAYNIYARIRYTCVHYTCAYIRMYTRLYACIRARIFYVTDIRTYARIIAHSSSSVFAQRQLLRGLSREHP